jgi:hypothetical protein
LIGPGAKFTCLQVVLFVHVASDVQARTEPDPQLALHADEAE